MKRLAIIGASGHGKVVADCAVLCGWESIVFFDDAWPDKRGNSVWKVEGDTAALVASIDQFDGVTVAIGDNKVRDKKIGLFIEKEFPLVTLIHPRASVSHYALIGAGSVICAGAVVNADSRIGHGAIINTGSTVDHDCVLSNSVHVSPGANLAGGVRVGARSWIGIGSSVCELVSIGTDVVIGAGAAVIRDIPDRCIAVGVPARVRY